MTPTIPGIFRPFRNRPPLLLTITAPGTDRSPTCVHLEDRPTREMEFAREMLLLATSVDQVTLLARFKRDTAYIDLNEIKTGYGYSAPHIKNKHFIVGVTERVHAFGRQITQHPESVPIKTLETILAIKAIIDPRQPSRGSSSTNTSIKREIARILANALNPNHHRLMTDETGKSRPNPYSTKSLEHPAYMYALSLGILSDEPFYPAPEPVATDSRKRARVEAAEPEAVRGNSSGSSEHDEVQAFSKYVAYLKR